MKYIIVQGDGMADRPLPDLGGRTPLDVAQTPNLDRMASRGILGMTPTIPRGLSAAGEIGTMSILGYDPRCYQAGRSALEAASLGVALGPEDVAYCCGLVSIDRSEGVERMQDVTAGRLGSAESAGLMADVQRALGNGEFEFHPGLGPRHLLVWRKGQEAAGGAAPHDIAGQAIAAHRPTGAGAETLRRLMERAGMVLRDHTINHERRARGEPAATDVWLWGCGKSLEVPTLKARFGLDGAVVAAMDLVNGLGVLAGLDRVRVPGATGSLDTDYGAKVAHGLQVLDDHNFLFLHVQAPDEAGHMGNVAEKIKAIEAIDSLVIGRLFDGLAQFGDWRLMVLPDHVTPCALKVHTDEPVPFVVFSSNDLAKAKGPSRRYTEADARDDGIFIPEAYTLIERLLRR